MCYYTEAEARAYIRRTDAKIESLERERRVWANREEALERIVRRIENLDDRITRTNRGAERTRSGYLAAVQADVAMSDPQAAFSREKVEGDEDLRHAKTVCVNEANESAKNVRECNRQIQGLEANIAEAWQFIRYINRVPGDD